MNSSDIAAIWFWPVCALIAFGACSLLRRRGLRGIRFWFLTASFTFTIGGLFGLFPWVIHGIQSTIVLFDFHFGVLLLGLVLIAGVPFFLFAPPEIAQMSRPVKGILAVAGTLISGFFIYDSGSTLFGDYLRDRKIVSGTVSDIGETRGLRAPSRSFMFVGLEKAYLTRRMAPGVKVGDRIRAEVGRGSDYVYALDKLP